MASCSFTCPVVACLSFLPDASTLPLAAHPPPVTTLPMVLTFPTPAPAPSAANYSAISPLPTSDSPSPVINVPRSRHRPRLPRQLDIELAGLVTSTGPLSRAIVRGTFHVSRGVTWIVSRGAARAPFVRLSCDPVVPCRGRPSSSACSVFDELAGSNFAARSILHLFVPSEELYCAARRRSRVVAAVPSV